MVKQRIFYACDFCDNVYDTHAQADKCGAKGVTDLPGGPFYVGDIVECGQSFGWHKRPSTIWARIHDSNHPHHAKRTSEIDVADGGKRMYAPVWIVSKITAKDHRFQYHLYCPYHPFGEPCAAYTTPDHMKMKKFKPSPDQLLWVQINRSEWVGREADIARLV